MGRSAQADNDQMPMQRKTHAALPAHAHSDGPQTRCKSHGRRTSPLTNAANPP